MKPIRIAAQLHPQHGDYPGIRAAALRAEQLGYDLVYTWDHFFPLYGTGEASSLECWTVLAALAADYLLLTGQITAQEYVERVKKQGRVFGYRDFGNGRAVSDVVAIVGEDVRTPEAVGHTR
jgi:hypothetical protein